MCDVNAMFARYFYLNTVLHLIAVSYERYKAIVKSPLTYHGNIATRRVALMALIWIIPIPFVIGPFIGWGKYVYNDETFHCEQGWAETNAVNVTFYVLFSFIAPFLVIAFLNWRVFRTARTLQRNIVAVQFGSQEGSELQGQVVTRRLREWKAAVDVSIIIVAFLLCFFPAWITGVIRQFFTTVKIPARAMQAISCIFIFSSLCNPIIYSIRKKEFRAGVKRVFRRMGICRSAIDIADNLPRNARDITDNIPRNARDISDSLTRITDNLPSSARDQRRGDTTRSEAFFIGSLTRQDDHGNHNELYTSTDNVAGVHFRNIALSPIPEIVSN